MTTHRAFGRIKLGGICGELYLRSYITQEEYIELDKFRIRKDWFNYVDTLTHLGIELIPNNAEDDVAETLFEVRMPDVGTPIAQSPSLKDESIFVHCKLKHAVRMLDKRGLLAPATVTILEQVMSKNRWISVFEQLGAMNGITLNAEDDDTLIDGEIIITIVVNKERRAQSLAMVASVRAYTASRQNGKCRSIW